jgi:formyltetrahydrofolate hydrolase
MITASNDLLVRTRSGELPVEIAAVVSNHADLEGLAAWHGVPFHHIPVTPGTKAEAEARLLELVDAYEVELVVLARYMQVPQRFGHRPGRRQGHQISTIPSCPASRAQNRTTRRMSAE